MYRMYNRGFLASGVLVLKMIGMGIGLSIVMDATVIRCVLLPSIMAVMGSYVSPSCVVH